ncbi:thiocillin family RiPP [Nonomuraea sp. NBC_00507]|uniref:thiocillin family RiPP n=1 Tax=Nonomuraea sp. NBC_00507 TaxID=2976002 RepID=UPI002E170E97
MDNDHLELYAITESLELESLTDGAAAAGPCINSASTASTVSSASCPASSASSFGSFSSYT